jgi:hypothetical protein
MTDGPPAAALDLRALLATLDRHASGRPADVRDIAVLTQIDELRQGARSSSATHSMCGVCGNMSTGTMRRSA